MSVSQQKWEDTISANRASLEHFLQGSFEFCESGIKEYITNLVDVVEQVGNNVIEAFPQLTVDTFAELLLVRHINRCDAAQKEAMLRKAFQSMCCLCNLGGSTLDVFNLDGSSLEYIIKGVLDSCLPGVISLVIKELQNRDVVDIKELTADIRDNTHKSTILRGAEGSTVVNSKSTAAAVDSKSTILRSADISTMVNQVDKSDVLEDSTVIGDNGETQDSGGDQPLSGPTKQNMQQVTLSHLNQSSVAPLIQVPLNCAAAELPLRYIRNSRNSDYNSSSQSVTAVEEKQDEPEKQTKTTYPINYISSPMDMFHPTERHFIVYPGTSSTHLVDDAKRPRAPMLSRNRRTPHRADNRWLPSVVKQRIGFC